MKKPLHGGFDIWRIGEVECTADLMPDRSPIMSRGMCRWIDNKNPTKKTMNYNMLSKKAGSLAVMLIFADCAVSTLHADTVLQRVNASLVTDQGDWSKRFWKPGFEGKFTNHTLGWNEPGGIQGNYAGMLYYNPALTGEGADYCGNVGQWVHCNSRGINVDVFNRIQNDGRILGTKAYLKVNSDGGDMLDWSYYYSYPKHLPSPVWTGQTFDVAQSNYNKPIYATWRCGVRYPVQYQVQPYFNAMHELYCWSGSTQMRIQIELRQSPTHGTSYSAKTFYYNGYTWYVNGFSHPAYKVWTFTRKKSEYQWPDTGGKVKDWTGTLELQGFVEYLKNNQGVWGGNAFPKDAVVKRVETGFESWAGGEGSEFWSSDAHVRN